MEQKKIKVLKSDRNEIRYHVATGTITVLYSHKFLLDRAWEMLKIHGSLEKRITKEG